MGNCVFREMGLEEQVWSPERQNFFKEEYSKYLEHEERVLHIVEQRKQQREIERIQEMERQRILAEQKEAEALAEQQRIMAERIKAIQKQQEEEEQKSEEDHNDSQDLNLDKPHQKHNHKMNKLDDEDKNSKHDLTRFFTIKANLMHKSKVQQSQKLLKQSQIADMPKMFENPVFHQTGPLSSEIKQEKFSNVFSDDD